jgi:response regulator RpfG family c-di-GMP phosphodiesterase
LIFDFDFALVLLYVQMPGTDGFETAEFLWGSDKTRLIPIIFVTAINKVKKYIFRRCDIGAADYLFNSIEPESFKAEVMFYRFIQTAKCP